MNGSKKKSGEIYNMELKEVDNIIEQERRKQKSIEAIVDRLKENVKQVYDKKGYYFFKEQEKTK